MDHLKQLGTLALGSRLKRISDSVMKQVAEVYKSQDVDFEPKWFPLYSLLLNNKQLSIMECSQQLSISHPAVNQFANQMVKKGIIEEFVSETDKRKRFLRISKKGIQLEKELKPIWDKFSLALENIFDNSNFDLVGAISDFENSVEENKYYNSVVDLIKKDQLEEVKIINYKPKYDRDFERLNVEWLNKYFAVEEFDKKIFANPKKEVINKGGKIIFAEYKNEIVGTVALFKIDKNTVELAKMGVTEKVQGKQIGKKLMEAIIQIAKDKGFPRVILVSNTSLAPAINMYKKFGFKQIPLTNNEKSQYDRSNIKMELIF